MSHLVTFRGDEYWASQLYLDLNAIDCYQEWECGTRVQELKSFDNGDGRLTFKECELDPERPRNCGFQLAIDRFPGGVRFFPQPSAEADNNAVANFLIGEAVFAVLALALLLFLVSSSSNRHPPTSGLAILFGLSTLLGVHK